MGGGGATVNTVSTVTVMLHVVDGANFTINLFKKPLRRAI